VTATAEFRVPVARDAHGTLVSPEDAQKRRRYTCPSCGAPVDLHAGEKKRRHFHHAVAACSAETVLHVSAKELVVQAVARWRAGGASPVLVRACAEDGCDAVTRQTLPKKVLGAQAEVRLASGHVVDVALTGPGGLAIAAIEIRHTHAVDEDKALDLGVPWIEVDAAATCAAMGRELVPVRDKFLPWLCADHAGRRGVAKREERAEKTTRARLAKKLAFDLAAYPGFRIARVARCPRGHDALVFAWDGDTPPWPRPPLVVAHAAGEDALFDKTQRKMRSVLAFRRSYVSKCAVCGEKLVEA
jgi:hypothetical protein